MDYKKKLDEAKKVAAIEEADKKKKIESMTDEEQRKAIDEASNKLAAIMRGQSK
jgi:hypothetical protein